MIDITDLNRNLILGNLAAVAQRQVSIAQQQQLLSLLKSQDDERQRLESLPKCPMCAFPCELTSQICGRCGTPIFITGRLWAVHRGRKICVRDGARELLESVATEIVQIQKICEAESLKQMATLASNVQLLGLLTADDSPTKQDVLKVCATHRKQSDNWWGKQGQIDRINRLIAGSEYFRHAIPRYKAPHVYDIVNTAKKSHDDYYWFRERLEDLDRDYQTISQQASGIGAHVKPPLPVPIAFRGKAMPSLNVLPEFWPKVSQELIDECMAMIQVASPIYREAVAGDSAEVSKAEEMPNDSGSATTPSPASAGHWWIRTPDGKQSGPHTKEQLAKAAAAGTLTAGTVAASSPNGPWKPVRLRKPS